MRGILFFSKLVFTIFLIIFTFLSLAFAIILDKLHADILFKHTVEQTYEEVSTEDALVSLLNYKDKDTGITFKEALIYAIYEDSWAPTVLKDGEWQTVNISKLAERFFYDSGACSRGKVLLFITDGRNYKPIYQYRADIDSFGERSSRASVPITSNKWLVLYEGGCW